MIKTAFCDCVPATFQTSPHCASIFLVIYKRLIEIYEATLKIGREIGVLSSTLLEAVASQLQN